MSRKPINYTDYINRPLYTIDLNDSDCNEELLNFLNAQYAQISNCPREISRIANQNEDLAFYAGYACPLGSRESVILTDTGGYTLKRKRSFTKIGLTFLTDIVHNLVSRSVLRKPNFLVVPKNAFLMNEKGKARAAKKFLTAQVQDPSFQKLFPRHITNMYIFGESYLEVFWNPDKGPVQSISKEKVPLLDDEGKPALNEEGEKILLDSAIRIGDKDTRLLDPRRVLIQKADDFDKSEWVLHFDYISTDKLRQQYPDFADEIIETENIESFDDSYLSYTEIKNKTVLFRLNHRRTPELPEGRLIIATPDVILHNTAYPHPSVLEHDLFPIIQLRLEDMPNTERGVQSIISRGKHIQLAINNLINSQVRNVALFPPMRVYEEGSVDKDKLRISGPTDVTYRRNRTPPHVVTSETVSQPVILLINLLIEKLQQLSNVLPISRGDTIPNTESRQMLDFFKDQESAQGVPIEDKIKDNVIELAKLWMAIAADEYKSSEKSLRMIRYYGERKRLVQSDIDPTSLKIPYDLNIDTLNIFADTPQGKIDKILQLNQLSPDLITKSKMLDILEIADPEEYLDTVTAGTDLAQQEISDILEGKDIAPPQRYVNLLPYYEEYFRVVQQPDIRAILPDVYDPTIDAKTLKGSERIAQNLLDQMAAIEFLMQEAMEDHEAQGMVTENGKCPLRLEVLTRFPCFPTLLKTVSPEIVDPFELQEESIPQELSSQEMENPQTNLNVLPPNL